MIIGTAFLCGINNVYVPYVTSPHLGRYEYGIFSFLNTVFSAQRFSVPILLQWLER